MALKASDRRRCGNSGSSGNRMFRPAIAVRTVVVAGLTERRLVGAGGTVRAQQFTITFAKRCAGSIVVLLGIGARRVRVGIMHAMARGTGHAVIHQLNSAIGTAGEAIIGQRLKRVLRLTRSYSRSISGSCRSGIIGHNRMRQRRIGIINKPLLMTLLTDQVTSGSGTHQFCTILLTMGVVTDRAGNPVGGNSVPASIKGRRGIRRTSGCLGGQISAPIM